MKPKLTPWSGKPVQVVGVPPAVWRTETAFQIYCATWLRKQYELTGCEGYRWWHHSANEREGARAGFRAKLMGQARGYPDFVNHGLMVAVELKVHTGVVAQAQKDWLEHFHLLGYWAEVVRTFEQFESITLEAIRQKYGT